jgi:hypothetical protein
MIHELMCGTPNGHTKSSFAGAASLHAVEFKSLR